MLTLLIVDDEATVANGLARDVCWQEAGIGSVFTAENGSEALGIMEETRVDVVLSDINMPRLGGVGLATEVRKRWPLAKVIFFTGYDQLDYAKKAIDLSVFRYLTKPVDDTEVLACVSAAVSEITSELDRTIQFSELEERLAEYMPAVRERFLTQWIEGRSPAGSLTEARLEQFDLATMNRAKAFLVLVRADEWVWSGTRHETLYEVSLRKMAAGMLLKTVPHCSFPNHDGDVMLLVWQTDERSIVDIRSKVVAACAAFQASVQSALGVVVALAVGRISPVEESPRTYQELMGVLRSVTAVAPGRIVDLARDMIGSPMIDVRSLSAEPGLSHYVESLNEREAVAFVSAVFGEIASLSAVSGDVLQIVYCRVLDSLLTASIDRGIEPSAWLDDRRRLRLGFSRVSSVSELEKWTIANIRSFMREARLRRSSGGRSIVDRAKRYVAEHLGEDLSVGTIAQHLSVHPNYFSTIFSRSERVTVSEFIAHRRIEAAKRLLRVSGMKVYEVCELVGYHSASHFHRVFKRETGVSPKQYQISR